MPGPGCNPKMLDIYFQFPSCRIQHVKVTFVNRLEVFSFAWKRLGGLDLLPLQSTTWQLPKVVSGRLHSPCRPTADGSPIRLCCCWQGTDRRLARDAGDLTAPPSPLSQVDLLGPSFTIRALICCTLAVHTCFQFLTVKCPLLSRTLI